MGRQCLLWFFEPSSLKAVHCCPLSLWWETQSKKSAQYFSCKCVSLINAELGGLLVYEFQLSRVLLFTAPWTAAFQASLSITNPWSLVKLMSIASVMPSNYLILCCTLLLLPSIFPSIRVFSNESVLRIRWPKYWSFSFSISQDWFPLGLTGLISLQSKGLSRVFPNTTVQKHQFFSA